MKTRLFTKSAIIMATAFSLASCSQEEELVNPNTNPNTNTKTGRTVFAAGGPTEDGTRTTMDNNRVYHWQYNDQIWVNDGGTWIKSMDSELAPDSKTANFFFDRVMTEPSYEVLYTGFNSNDPTKVTIPASFVTGSNNRFIGAHGDCGVATATRNPENGTYSFALLHKASYLGVAPLKSSYLNKHYVCTKIEITDVKGKPIAGTYNFNANGIDTTNVTSPSSTITLNTNDDTKITVQNYNSKLEYAWVVLPPSYRKLNIKYTFYEVSNPAQEFSHVKSLNDRRFIENNVVQLRHALTTEYYRWDAPFSEPFSGGFYNASSVPELTVAENSCASMPNPNEMYWYVLNGDPRWDEETEWTADGGASYHTGGVWIKKKSVILAEGKTFDSNVGYLGQDMRETNREYHFAGDSYRYGGKPEDTSKYFFLPALGFYGGGDHVVTDLGVYGIYWASCSSVPAVESPSVPRAYAMRFTKNSVGIGSAMRNSGCIAGNGSEWFK